MLLTLAALTAMTSPALAAGCPYVDREGNSLTFFGEEVGVSLAGVTETCSYSEPETERGIGIACESGLGGIAMFSDAEDDQPVLVLFDNRIWYRRCYEPT